MLHRNQACASKERAWPERNLLKMIDSPPNSRVTASSRQALLADDMMQTVGGTARLCARCHLKSPTIASDIRLLPPDIR